MALRVPIKWLQDYVDVTSLAPDELAERLTVAGLEVETVEPVGGWDPATVVVGQITAVLPHPNADRLCLAEVAYGPPEPLTVVTGAPNITRYLGESLPQPAPKVPFALVGAELIDGHAADGRKLKLKAGNIRGVRSEGMVCSE
ncbi:MAG: phenylalanine--tRNA ligase subunit beta, partial [Gammaproteobacteria bacterium]|nr:phenylalanine--tRNA ligase subunit beta [Gammaproteobacteria bacterium]